MSAFLGFMLGLALAFMLSAYTGSGAGGSCDPAPSGGKQFNINSAPAVSGRKVTTP